MAADVYVRVADETDAAMLAPRVRAVEVDEVRASMGCTALEALLKGVRESAEAWSVWFDGELACMWGVVRQPLPGVGCAWLLTSDLVERQPKTFWRTCLAILPSVLERWPLLINAIDTRHEQATRWATRLGVRWMPEALEANGQRFMEFRLTQEGHTWARQQ